MDIKSLHAWKPFGMTIQMELFATSVSGPLRFTLVRIAWEKERMGLYFWDEPSDDFKPLKASREWVDRELVRSIWSGEGKPETPEEQVDVIIRVLHDPTVRSGLEIDVDGSVTDPMIKAYYRSVDAMKEAEALNVESFKARPKEEAESQSKKDAARSGGRV